MRCALCVIASVGALEAHAQRRLHCVRHVACRGRRARREIATRSARAAVQNYSESLYTIVQTQRPKRRGVLAGLGYPCGVPVTLWGCISSLEYMLGPDLGA